MDETGRLELDPADQASVERFWQRLGVTEREPLSEPVTADPELLSDIHRAAAIREHQRAAMHAQMRQYEAAQQLYQLQKQVVAFMAAHPEAVRFRKRMAALLNSGDAKTLDEAYRLARALP